MSIPSFTRLLVPLDGSRLALQALSTVRRLVKPGTTQVTLLRVTAPEAELTLDHGSAARVAMRAQLDQAREALGADVHVEPVLLDGADPAEEITRYARTTGQELIAMSTHGRSGLQRLVRGSVAERVLRTTQVPLLLTTPRTAEEQEAGRFRRILVPLDGSSAAEEVLPLVERLAAAEDAVVELLYVEPLVTDELSTFLPTPSWKPEEGERRLRPVVERLEAKGLRARARAAHGFIAMEVLRAAEETDLLAMASHGRTGTARWWFGSVAEQVLRVARCPLLLVRCARR